jgi:hypothetical protein
VYEHIGCEDISLYVRSRRSVGPLLPAGSLRAKIKFSMPEQELNACRFTSLAGFADNLLDNSARLRTLLDVSYWFDLFVATHCST